jgi:hypothetical protein
VAALTADQRFALIALDHVNRSAGMVVDVASGVRWVHPLPQPRRVKIDAGAGRASKTSRRPTPSVHLRERAITEPVLLRAISEPRSPRDIYHSIYGEHHYLLGIAISNLAGAYAGNREWARAEGLFRQAVRLFTETQSADHINTGIARTKLGRTLLRQQRYAEAERESRAGYEVLVKQMAPGASWLVNSRKDLIEEYDALKEPENAERFHKELADGLRFERLPTKR